ncbi:MAG: FHA domain-containing protein [Acidimicrobiales bacterium]|nr:FHA domain-containing protein [Acidimicrobiales bacterium]
MSGSIIDELRARLADRDESSPVPDPSPGPAIEIAGGEVVRLARSESIVIGRIEDDGVVAAVALEPVISRRHCEIGAGPTGGLQLRDLGSANGTVVVRDGEATAVGTDDVSLRVGDRIETIHDTLIAEIVDSP